MNSRVASSTVSVVIPAYNSEPFIGQTLSSVFAQHRPPHEVVVVDDASSDETLAVVRREAARSPVPVRVVSRQRNSGGPARPLSLGIQAARGEVIALLDHDDLMLPGCLAEKLRVLEEYPELDQVFGDYEWFSDQGVQPDSDARGCGGEHHALLRTGERSPWIVSAAAAMQAFVGAPGLPGGCGNMCFRKTLWQRVGGFRPAAGPTSDYDFNLRSLDKAVAWIDRKLYRKRLHGGNLWKPTVANLLQTLRSQGEGLARFSELEELRRQVIERTVEFAQRRRWQGEHRASGRAGLELFHMGEYRHAVRELVKTLLALSRDAIGTSRGNPAIPSKQPEKGAG